MKILLTTHQFFPEYSAGTEVLTASVARDLVRRGHSVYVFTGHPSASDMREEDRFDEYAYQGILVFRFHHAYTPMAGQTSMIEVGYNNHLAAAYFARVLERVQPDVVHFFHLNRLGTGLIEEAAKAGIRQFMTPTDFWVICPTGQLVYGNGSLCTGPTAHAGNCVKHFASGTQSGVLREIAERLPTVVADRLVQWTRAGVLPQYPKRHEVVAMGTRLGTNISRLNRLNGLVVPNRFMGDLLVQYGVSPHLISQSEYGIDVTSDEGVGPRSACRNPLRVGFIGTHAPHKGCHVLIEAFKALPKGQAVLKIYGNRAELPEYSASMERLVASDAAIEFCGTFPNTQIAEVLHGLDVLVVPSLWYENTPLIVYSAQAAKCPVVASNFPGISSVIRDGVNGLLFPAGDVAAVANCLSRLVNEPGLAEYLSSNAQRPKSIAAYVDELLVMWEAPSQRQTLPGGKSG